ncbi:MAG: OmpA family protein [Desulfobacterales bacterium]|jgi:chemotaxis protein MotB|nr:OmpA family protein [Desulfobacterales bacterium]
MGNKRFIAVLSLVWLLLTACVSHQQLQDQNRVLNTELKHARIELYEAEEKIKSLNAELSKLQKENTHSTEKLTDLQSKNTYLKNINIRLSQNIERLSQNVERLNNDLKKKKSVIKLQNKVIRLLDDTKKTIATSLKEEIAAQEIELVEMEDTLKVVFIDKILFDSGSVEINQKGKKILLVVADSVRAHRVQNLLVEGHTDNMPLGPTLKERFPSNWELSAARAAAVVRFLQKKGRLQPERLSARGYSYFRSVASNETKEGRHQNRRIEIILGPSK